MSVMRTITSGLLATPLLIAGAALAAEYELDGTIESVDEANRTITVELDDSAETVTYSIQADTDIELFGNSKGDIDDLEPGQGVTLGFDDRQKLDEWIILHVIRIS